MICTTHPKYKVIRKPQSDCLTCWIMWEAKQSKNEVQPDPQHGREPFKAGVMQVCNNCVFQNKAVVGNCCSPIACKHQQRELEPKPLAQYLATVSDMGMLKTQAFFQQALDAYESTEGVVIQIIRKKRI